MRRQKGRGDPLWLQLGAADRRRLSDPRCPAPCRHNRRAPVPQRRAWRSSLLKTSVTEILEALRRRADDGCPLGHDFQHGEAALHKTVRRKTKQSVDAGEAARVEDRLLRERLPGFAACQKPRGGPRVITQRNKKPRG